MVSMNAVLSRRPARVLIAIAVIAAMAAVVIVPRVAGQEADPLDFEVVMAGDSFERAPAAGNDSSEEGFPSRGDVMSAQGAVYAAGDAGGERIGTFYFFGSVTAETEHFATAANHLYVVGHIELFDRGTLAVTGVTSFFNESTVAITGGTGSYASASGQCTTVTIDEIDHWQCDVQ
jgi:hypothetical protein